MRRKRGETERRREKERKERKSPTDVKKKSEKSAQVRNRLVRGRSGCEGESKMKSPSTAL